MTDLPKGWVDTLLGDLVEFQYGKSLPKKDRIPGPYLVYGSNGVVGTHADAITKAPAIIIGRKGSIGEVHFSEARCFPIDTTYFVDDFLGNLPRFVEYLLRVLPLMDLNRASAVPGLNREDAYALRVSLPPIAEQRRIVTRLDLLMGCTARARADLERVATLITNYKKAFLAAAFSGELTQEWRQAEGLPDAEEVELGTLLTDIRYGTAQKCYAERKGVAVLRIPNVSSGRIDLTDLKYAELDSRDFDRLRLEVGDVLVVRSNGSVELVGRPALVTKVEAGLAYAGYLIRLRPNHDLVVAQYLVWMLEAPQIRRIIEIGARSTSGVHNVNSLELAALRIPGRQLSEQYQIVSRLEAAFTWVDKIATEHARALLLMRKLNQAILAKAFHGGLAPQDANDEPASELLARIRAARAEVQTDRRGVRPFRELKPRAPREKAAMTKSRFDEDVKNKPYLASLLREIGKLASVEELFKRAQLPVSDFYKQLAWEVEAGHIRDDNKRLGAA